MVPFTIGKLIGLQINKNKIKQIGGISGNISVMPSKIKMKIGDHIMSVNISWSLSEDVSPLLGRKDVFDKFKITFDQNAETILFQD